MDPSLLSKHSSNPLQAPSDDPINGKYLQDLSGILKREKNRGDRDPSSVHNNGVSEPEDLMSTSDGVLGNDYRSEYDDEDMLDDDEGEEDVEEELDEEERTLFEKDEQEQAQILAEIEDLENTVPTLQDDFKLIDRLGEGMSDAFLLDGTFLTPRMKRYILVGVQGDRPGTSSQVV